MGAGETTVVFFDDTAAVGAWCGQGGVIAWNCFCVEFFGAFDDDLRHLMHVAHEGIALDFTAFHLCEAMFPVASQFCGGQLFDAQTAQQGQQLKSFGGWDQLTAFAHEVFFK